MPSNIHVLNTRSWSVRSTWLGNLCVWVRACLSVLENGTMCNSCKSFGSQISIPWRHWYKPSCENVHIAVMFLSLCVCVYCSILGWSLLVCVVLMWFWWLTAKEKEMDKLKDTTKHDYPQIPACDDVSGTSKELEKTKPNNDVLCIRCFLIDVSVLLVINTQYH